MKFNFFRKSSSVIGLHIHQYGIFLAQLRQMKNTFRIEQIASHKFINNLFVDDKIKDWNNLTNILTDMVRSLDLKGKYTVISLPANLVHMQKIQIPCGLNESEIQASINAQLQRDLPSMMDDLCVDFTFLSKNLSGYDDVHFTVSKQTYLERYLAVISAAGLIVRRVDVDIYALLRVIQFALPDIKNPLIAQILQTSARIFFSNSQQILFFNDWPVKDIGNITQQFINQLRICFTAHQDIPIKHLVCISEEYNFIELASQFGLKLHYPDIFVSMQINANLDLSLLSANVQEFMTAYGLAMSNLRMY